MGVPSNNATASSVNGTLVATRILLGNNDKQVRVVLSGTYTGLQGTIDVSMDGTTYINKQAIQEDSGVLVNGTLNPSAANLSYLIDCEGWLYARFNCSQCSSGTAVQTLYSGAALASQRPPIIANTNSTSSFTSGTFSGTLGVSGAATLSSTLAVTGATTLTGTVSAQAGTFATTLGVTGLATLTGGAAAGAKLYPSTDDGAALGDTTHNWSDIFLATGAVLNFANGNSAITHSSAVLTVGTGDLRVTTAGTNAASVVTVGGTQTLAAKTLTTPVIGVATGTSLAVTDLLTSSSPSAGIGYATGAGGAVTQITSRATGVTLSKLCGTITTDTTSLAAGAEAEFTVTNTTVAATDVVNVALASGNTGVGTCFPFVSAVAAGSFKITISNLHASTAETGACVLNFNVIKGVAA